jgi:hypothetical protein
VQHATLSKTLAAASASGAICYCAQQRQLGTACHLAKALALLLLSGTVHSTKRTQPERTAAGLLTSSPAAGRALEARVGLWLPRKAQSCLLNGSCCLLCAAAPLPAPALQHYSRVIALLWRVKVAAVGKAHDSMLHGKTEAHKQGPIKMLLLHVLC